MKMYLAKFTIYEGEHEHRGEFMLEARNYKEAENIARTQEHGPEFPEDDEKVTYWDYGDATTASRLAGIVEITQEEAATIERLGLAYRFK